MASFERDGWLGYIGSRLRGYATVCTYNVAGSIANLAIIATFGATANLPLKVAIAISIIAVAAISVLPAKSIFDDMAALLKDRPPELEGTAFVQTYDDSPIGLFATLTIGFNGVLAAAQLWALFSM